MQNTLILGAILKKGNVVIKCDLLAVADLNRLRFFGIAGDDRAAAAKHRIVALHTCWSKHQLLDNPLRFAALSAFFAGRE